LKMWIPKGSHLSTCIKIKFPFENGPPYNSTIKLGPWSLLRNYESPLMLFKGKNIVVWAWGETDRIVLIIRVFFVMRMLSDKISKKPPYLLAYFWKVFFQNHYLSNFEEWKARKGIPLLTELWRTFISQ